MDKATRLVTAASNRVGWVEFLIPLIPMLAEMLVEIIQNCTNTEDEAVTMLCEPEDWEFNLMTRRVRRALWFRSREFRRLSFRDKTALATQVVKDQVTVANENPDAVCEAFREVHQ